VVVDYLAGRLVRLRALEPEDEPSLHAWVNDPVVTEYLSLRYPFSHRQESDYIASVSTGSESAQFGIVTLDEGRLVGDIGLHHGHPENRCATLGIMIGDRSRWGMGYGTDAVRTVCRFGFEVMNLHRIELEVFLDNSRAIAVYERVGFQHEGRRREAAYKGGRYHDSLVMGLLRQEWR
jgi:RimJ/RimL family protein N-acetyltransferase